MFKNKNRNVKDSILYTFGNYIFRISMLITNIIASNLLGPTIAGVIAYINAIDQNINVGYSTVRASLEREIPKLRASKEIDEANKFAASSFTISYLLFLIGSVFYFILYLTNEDEYIKLTCLFFIGINFLKAFSDLLRIYHKANLNFSSITKTLLIISLIQPLLVFYAVNQYFYVGFLWSRVFLFTLSSLLLIVLLKKYPKISFKLEFNYVKKLFAIGLPIVLFGLILTILVTIDKFYIKADLGAESLGYYSIGALIFQLILVLPQSIYGSYFPKFITYLGDQTKQISKLSNLIKLVIVPAIFITWLIIPIFIKLALPEYVLGIQSAKILIFSSYFAASYQMYYFELIRINKFKKLIITTIIILLFCFGLYTFISPYANSIEDYAWINVIVFFVFSFSIIYLTLLEMGKSLKTTIKQMFFDLIKILPLIIVFSIDYVFDYSVKTELIKLTIFIILFSPYLYLNKNVILSFIPKKNK